jgi:hypothetical protein
MTLLITEIHPIGVLQEPVIIFAADRCISSQGHYYATRKKLFSVHGQRAGIGFFGLAEFSSGSKKIDMSEWLKKFITSKSRNPSTLKELADGLAEELNRLVPRHIRDKFVSGFHLAGLNKAGMPEFWFIRNIEDDGTTISGTYSGREDFLRRDAKDLPTGGFATYRNGDIRGHIAGWELFDEAFIKLFQEPDFRPPKSSEEYGSRASNYSP